jgi:hypothetical protein
MCVEEIKGISTWYRNYADNIAHLPTSWWHFSKSWCIVTRCFILTDVQSVKSCKVNFGNSLYKVFIIYEYAIWGRCELLIERDGAQNRPKDARVWSLEYHICVSAHYQYIILINQLDATLCSLIYSLLWFTLHVSGAFCIHHQE